MKKKIRRQKVKILTEYQTFHFLRQLNCKVEAVQSSKMYVCGGIEVSIHVCRCSPFLALTSHKKRPILLNPHSVSFLVILAPVMHPSRQRPPILFLVFPLISLLEIPSKKLSLDHFFFNSYDGVEM